MTGTYDKQKPKAPQMFSSPNKETVLMSKSYKTPCDPPAIKPELQLKWGLALLGKEKASEYLTWLRRRFEDNSQ